MLEETLMTPAKSPAMSEDDQRELENYAEWERLMLDGLRQAREAQREILRRNRIRHAERVGPRVLQMRAPQS